MITRSADPDEDGVLMLVVNAARKEEDYAHVAAGLPAGVRLAGDDPQVLMPGFQGDGTLERAR